VAVLHAAARRPRGGVAATSPCWATLARAPRRYISDTVALPWSVCPYNPKHSINDTVCTAYRRAQLTDRAVTPLALHVSGVR